MEDDGQTRSFATGAVRDTAHNKIDPEGCLSPRVLDVYCDYMLKHQQMAETWRDSDNWQKGMPPEILMKSLARHYFDVWAHHREEPTREDYLDSLCGVLFNAMALIYEQTRDYEYTLTDEEKHIHHYATSPVAEKSDSCCKETGDCG